MNEYLITDPDHEGGFLPNCSACGGWLEYMGTMGKTEWARCQNCGMNDQIPAIAVKEETDDEDHQTS